MVDGNESQLAQPFTLHAVVHDVAQAVERSPLLQLLFSFLDGRGHAKTEATAVVNLNL